MPEFLANMSERVAPVLAMAPSPMRDGGPVLWLLAALSVLALALALWKLLRLMGLGAWRKGRGRRAAALWREGHEAEARAQVAQGRGVLARVARTAMDAATEPGFDPASAREETERVATLALAEMRAGLRGLETIVTIAPLLGLLGTVLGMIEAFQALQDSGTRADPAALAGGIWEALLTTAAGMAVAIPAGIALNYFESVVDTMRITMEDVATRILARPRRATPSDPA